MVDEADLLPGKRCHEMVRREPRPGQK